MKPVFIVVMTKPSNGFHEGTQGVYESKEQAIKQSNFLAINNGPSDFDYEVQRVFLNTPVPVELKRGGNQPLPEIVHTANYKHFQKKLNEHTKENIK